jgi:hypothetical protein
MAIPREIKLKLIERFTPILYLDPAEPHYPVSPADFVTQSALWSSSPPTHPKGTWGLPAGADRRPLIEPRGISLNPAEDVRGASDPDGDGVPEHYLGQNDDGRFPFLAPRGGEVWFDLSGWQDGAKVTPSSANRRTSDADRPPLRQPWFSADVWDFDDFARQLGPDALARRFGLGPGELPEPFDRLVVVAYHFLFPVHRQPRRLTALAPEVDPFSGDYEGDWASFAVLTRRPAEPARAEQIDEYEPFRGGFGQRWRGIRVEHEDQALSRVQFRPWGSLVRAGDHAAVMVAPGTHNLYPHDQPVGPAGTIHPQWIEFGQSASEPANAFARDTTEQPWSPVMALKVLVGFALGGPFGALVGIAAAKAEASWAEENNLFNPELAPPNDEAPPGDDPLADDASDLEKDKISTPQSVAAPPFAGPNTAEIRGWVSTAEDALGEGSLLFPWAASNLPRYSGRWGVRCDLDGLSLRSGIQFPDWRAELIDSALKDPG